MRAATVPRIVACCGPAQRRPPSPSRLGLHLKLARLLVAPLLTLLLLANFARPARCSPFSDAVVRVDICVKEEGVILEIMGSIANFN